MPPPLPAYAAGPPAEATTLATTTTALAVTLPRRAPGFVRDEPRAVRAAEERIAAQYSHVWPHAGPGSGSGLNYCISKMYGDMERLDTWKDDDTDQEDEEEAARKDAQEHIPRITRLMSYSGY